MRLFRWTILCVFSLAAALPDDGKKLIKVVKIRPKDGNGEETSLVLRDGKEESFAGYGDRVKPKSKQLDLASFRNDRWRTESKTTTTPRSVTTTTLASETTSSDVQPVTTTVRNSKRILTTVPPITSTTVLNSPSSTKKSSRKNKKKSRNKSKVASTSPNPTTVPIHVVEDLSASEEVKLDNIKLLKEDIKISTLAHAATEQTVANSETTPPAPILPAIAESSESAEVSNDVKEIKPSKEEKSEPRLSHNILVFEKPPPSFSEFQNLESQSSNQYSSTERLPEGVITQNQQTAIYQTTAAAPVIEHATAHQEVFFNQAFTTVASTTAQPASEVITTASSILPEIVPVQLATIPQLPVQEIQQPPTSTQRVESTQDSQRTTAYTKASVYSLYNSESTSDSRRTTTFTTPTAPSSIFTQFTQDPRRTTTFTTARAPSSVFTQPVRTVSQLENSPAPATSVNGIGSKHQDKPFDLLAIASKFSCTGRVEGYYADIEAECKAWHWCTPGDRKFTFTCPNGTRFNQKHQVCDWRSNVKCSKSAEHFPKPDNES